MQTQLQICCFAEKRVPKQAFVKNLINSVIKYNCDSKMISEDCDNDDVIKSFRTATK